ncbi:MAG: DUF975 family protein [Planctomycetes bacterium]|nr:DUF975 family protein [Planctomycetota bacterium]
MPIEFRCTQCNRLLRTQDETAGKQAKCPECGTVLMIPAVGSPPASAGPPAGSEQPGATPPPPPGAGPASPFGSVDPPAPGAASPFGQGTSADADNPYASPADYTVGAQAAYTPARGPIVPTQIEMGGIFGSTWEIFKEKWGIALGILVVAVLINFGVNIFSTFIPVVGGIISSLFSIWLNIGVALGLLKIVRDEPAEIGDIFTGGPYFLRIFGGSLLFGFMILGAFAICFGPPMAALWFGLQGADESVMAFAAIGLALVCAIPVAVLSLMFGQFYYLIIDQDMGVMESLGRSKEVMVGNKLMVFLINLLAGLITMPIIIFTCGLGLLAAGPFLALLKVVVYMGVTGQRTVGEAGVESQMV